MIYEIIASPRSGSTYLYHVINYYFSYFKRSNDGVNGRLHEPFCLKQTAITPVTEILATLKEPSDHIMKNLLNDYQFLVLSGIENYNEFMLLPKKRIILTRKIILKEH